MSKLLVIAISFSFFLIGCSYEQKTSQKVDKSIESLAKNDSLELNTIIDKPTEENHMKAMELIFGRPKHTIRSIGILVYDGVNELDLFGPRYVLGQAMGAKTELISIKPGTITTSQGIEVTPNTVIDDVKKLDILLIPGGLKGTVEATYNEELHDWIRQIDETTTYTASVCTGGWILGATGLLKGKRASTNWYQEKKFLTKYGATPGDQRYTKDGKYWTSAGVTAGMDMSIAILQDIFGDRYAQAVMLDMEYDPDPPVEGGTPEKTDWSVRWMMKTMYGGALNPLIDSLEQIN